MEMRVSSNGEVTLSEAIVRGLGAAAGDIVEVEVDPSRIIVRPQPVRTGEATMITDPLTGFRAIHIEGAPVLTSREVEEALADFP